MSNFLTVRQAAAGAVFVLGAGYAAGVRADREPTPEIVPPVAAPIQRDLLCPEDFKPISYRTVPIEKEITIDGETRATARIGAMAWDACVPATVGPTVAGTGEERNVDPARVKVYAECPVDSDLVSFRRDVDRMAHPSVLQLTTVTLQCADDNGMTQRPSAIYTSEEYPRLVEVTEKDASHFDTNANDPSLVTILVQADISETDLSVQPI